MAAKRCAQDVGNQDQHLVAIQMPKAVVDLFEMVDVDHGQPLQHRFGRRGAIVACQRVGDRTGPPAHGVHRVARELLVKGFAVEQAGERVAFAVIQQTLVVLVDLKHAHPHIHLVRRERARLRDLQAGAHLVVHLHR
ncbi:hypothetical protein D3C72_2087360 [compost metagenome]